MAWYWVLLIVVGCQGLFLLVFWLLTRNKGGDLNKDLEDSTTKRLQAELEAEKKKGKDISSAYQNLADKFKEVAVWYNATKDQIKEESIRDFKAIAGNPDTIDTWLDSFTSPVSDTKPTSSDSQETKDEKE